MPLQILTAGSCESGLVPVLSAATTDFLVTLYDFSKDDSKQGVEASNMFHHVLPLRLSNEK
jgi:hypothetical protein